jgi:peptidoglycan-associated lipoprotein
MRCNGGADMKRKIAIAALLLALAACAGAPPPDTQAPPSSSSRSGADGGNQRGGIAGIDRNIRSSDLTDAQRQLLTTDLANSVGDRVFFLTDRSDLTAEAQRILQGQAEWMRRYPNLTFTIEGHADERGTREYNLALGDRRATMVKNFLIAAGIADNRLRTVSYGKERPVVVASNEAAWAQNRRGVTTID